MKQIIKNLVKISTLSLMFILSFFIINTFANSGEKQEVETKPNNNANYKKIIVNPISNVAVAITTNIGLGLNKKGGLSETKINNKIYKIDDFYLNSENIKDGLIRYHMLYTKEYFNIMKMDFSGVLKKSKNKEKTLEILVKQLKIRFNGANSNIVNLNKQKSILINEHTKITTQIETLKRNLETDFNKNEANKVFTHVDNYYTLKEKEIILNTNIIFLNNFLRKYTILNKYNNGLLNALILNKDAISKNSYVVIPKTGTQILKEFDLLYSEEEYKNIK